MEIVFLAVIIAILNGCLPYANSALTGIVPITLHAETYMTTMLGNNGFTGAFNILFGFGVSLIVLKFLKKGFEVYILWTEGDANADPLQLLVGFFKALIIAVSFPTLYGWLASTVGDLSNTLVASIGTGMDENFSTVVSAASSAGIFTALVALAFFVCFFLLYIQFLIRGLEILILRIGMPLACVGLMDSDKGVFRHYVQKLFQSTIAVIVQVVLAKIGVALMLNVHILWGIAAIVSAIKAPRLLSEFVIAGEGMQGMKYAGYQANRLLQMAKAVIK